MKNLLRKLLGIQTLKIVLFNPDTINIETLAVVKRMPVWFIACNSINDIKVIDTGIVVKKKKK